MNKKIVFTKPCTAEFLEEECKPVVGTLVKVRTIVSTVSCGTEKANIVGKEMVSYSSGEAAKFPVQSGYEQINVYYILSSETGMNCKIFAGVYTNN